MKEVSVPSNRTGMMKSKGAGGGIPINEVIKPLVKKASHLRFGFFMS